MRRRPPGSTRTDTLFPYTTLFRSHVRIASDHRHGHETPIDVRVDLLQGALVAVHHDLLANAWGQNRVPVPPVADLHAIGMYRQFAGRKKLAGEMVNLEVSRE